MIDYEEDWLLSLVFRRKGSLAFRASFFALPAAIVAVLLVSMDEWQFTLREEWSFSELRSSQVWTVTSAVLSALLSFRSSQAMSRFWEGTSLLHQMRGEWFDAVSCCVTFTRGARKEKHDQVKKFRHILVRLMSLCHGSALEEIKGAAESDTIEVIDVAGLDLGTLKLLHQCKEEYAFNRVELLLHLQQTTITKALDDKVITVAPPILSRVYQTLSRGFVNLLNAKKICDTKFPFPYAQLITILLLLNLVLTPILMSALFENRVWAFIFTFVPIFGMFSVNFIASELENPFGNDDNDLPLTHFQAEMNNCLMLLLHDHADHVPDLAPTCIMEFDMLFGSGGREYSKPGVGRGSCHADAILAAGQMSVAVSQTGSSAASDALDGSLSRPEGPIGRRSIRSIVTDDSGGHVVKEKTSPRSPRSVEDLQYGLPLNLNDEPVVVKGSSIDVITTVDHIRPKGMAVVEARHTIAPILGEGNCRTPSPQSVTDSNRVQPKASSSMRPKPFRLPQPSLEEDNNDCFEFDPGFGSVTRSPRSPKTRSHAGRQHR